MWSDVLGFLETARFDDLLLPGWIDRTGPFPVHRLLGFDAYLKAEGGLVRFTSVNNHGGLHIRLAGEIEYDEALRDDPDEDLVAASVGSHYLAASGPVRCTAMRLFTNNEAVPEAGIFRAAELAFDNGSVVFFDPFWIDGIRIGTTAAADLWLAEHHAPPLQAAFGLLQETTWRPNLR
ncbi:hypothetical protein [Hamadaea tsunoensis]|uniref:hypothetical protein n=1 Tax=Hamadaea tsunoensis TaxID=53368 RepID=UPI000685894E|nr:hypothetical protein [Hamadaea tsunoensis]